MKSLALVLWLVCALTPWLFSVMSWRPAQNQLVQQTQALADAQLQLDKLGADLRQIPEMVRQQTLCEQRLAVWSGTLSTLSPTGLTELQVLTRPPLRAQDWKSDSEPEVGTPTHTVNLVGPASAVVAWLHSVTTQRRGFLVTRAALRRRGKNLEGQVEIIALKLPAP